MSVRNHFENDEKWQRLIDLQGIIACQVYERRNTQLLDGLRSQTIDLAGDGRCDSPGFCAKYCTYSFHEARTKKIIHIEQVQVGEVTLTNTNEVIWDSYLQSLLGCEIKSFKYLITMVNEQLWAK